MSEAGTAPPAGAPRRPPEHYFLFDYLRIILAVGVFAAHADRGGLLPEEFGNGCVQIFFALSGFLIGGILLETAPRELPRFYFKRCTRIWVPYGIAIALLLAVTVLRQNLHDGKLWEFFFYKATFVYNLFGTPQLVRFHDHMPLQGAGNHFWSICVEEQFYLAAPFLILFLKRLRVPLLVALVAANVAWPHNFASISLGVLLAISRRHFGPWYLSARATAAAGAVVLATLGLWISHPPLYTLVAGPMAVALVALTARPGPIHPIGTVLGGMSYPFYLNHWIGLFTRKQFEQHLHQGPFGGSCLALLLALAISLVHYWVVDRPIHKARTRWYTRRRGKVALAVAIGLVVVGVTVGLALR